MSLTPDPFPGPDPLARAFGTPDPLATRIRIHAQYTQPQIDFPVWVLDQWGWGGQESVLDLGCGSGAYLAPLAARTAGRRVAADRFIGMLRDVQRTPAAPPLLAADALALPFPPGSFDLVLANHMLFLVPDLPRALAEIARVLRADGGLLAATNSAASMPELKELLRDARARAGFPGPAPAPAVEQGFSLENGAAWLAGHFASVQTARLDSALVFPEPAPALEFVSSLQALRAPLLPPGLTWPDLLSAAADLLDEHFRRHPDFRISKISAVFLARRPLVPGNDEC